MSEEAESAVVTQIPHLQDLSPDRIQALERSVLVTILEQMETAGRAPEEHVAGFTNFVSAQAI